MQRVTLVLVPLILLTACSEPRPNGPDETWRRLELTLAQQRVEVGTPVGYTVELIGSQGTVLPAEATITSDLEPGLAVTAEAVTATALGAHTLTATTTTDEGETLTASATLQVDPGPPATLTLTLSDDTPDVEQRVTATATMADAYGNPVEGAWTLSVRAESGSDEASVEIDEHRMTFNEEGWFTAVGTADETGVEGMVGPFVVDSFPPQITITNPERGTMTTEVEDTVTGTITDSFTDVTEATINGVPASLGADGSFSHPIEYDFGFNLIETIATDDGGSTATDRRAVLSGQYRPEGSGIEEGIIARVNQSTIDAVERFGESMIDDFDVAAVVPNPLYSNDSESCVFSVCVTWYELILRVNRIRRGASELELTPRDGGWIDVRATIRDVEVDWSASGVVTEIDYSASGTITADAVHVTGRVTPTVRDGRIEVDISQIDVSSDNFVFDWDSWIYDAAGFFGLDASSMVRGYVEGAIEDAVSSEVPALLQDVLRDLTLGTTFELFGNSYALEARPYDIDVDNAGLTLDLETFVSPTEWRSPHSGPGSLYRGYEAPGFEPTPGLIASFSADFLNQALYAFWGGGLLDQELDAESLGFDPAMLALMLEQLADLEIVVINGLMPPVVMPGTDGHLADLRAGDIEVTMHSGDPADPDTLLLHLYIGLEAGLELAVTDEMTLSATLTDIDAWIDVTEPRLPNNFELDTEELLYSLLPVLSGQITDALGEIPIPEIAGFGLAAPTISAAGDHGGYFNVAGELTGL